MTRHGRNRRRKLLEQIALLKASSTMGLQLALPSDIDIASLGPVLREELLYIKEEQELKKVIIILTISAKLDDLDILLSNYYLQKAIAFNGLRYVISSASPIGDRLSYAYIYPSGIVEFTLEGLPA